MHRFTIPVKTQSLSELTADLRRQFDRFLSSDSLQEIFRILHVDADSIRHVYNGRLKEGGRMIETQVMEPLEALEAERGRLYPLFADLGFFGINRPVRPDHSRVLVLGGSLNACFTRVRYAAEHYAGEVRSIDGLACYRPVNPVERAHSSYTSACETEFGAMCDAFEREFGLSQYEDQFCGDRNLNRISCVRNYVSGDEREFGVYAAPSAQPDQRRADTGDTLVFYLENAAAEQRGIGLPDAGAGESLLMISDNRHCNRQFIQLVCAMLDHGLAVPVDVVGCTEDRDIITPDRYDPYQYLQDLIGILDWTDRFNEKYNKTPRRGVVDQ